MTSRALVTAALGCFDAALEQWSMTPATSTSTDQDLVQSLVNQAFQDMSALTVTADPGPPAR